MWNDMHDLWHSDNCICFFCFSFSIFSHREKIHVSCCDIEIMSIFVTSRCLDFFESVMYIWCCCFRTYETNSSDKWLKEDHILAYFNAHQHAKTTWNAQQKIKKNSKNQNITMISSNHFWLSLSIRDKLGRDRNSQCDS